MLLTANHNTVLMTFKDYCKHFLLLKHSVVPKLPLAYSWHTLRSMTLDSCLKPHYNHKDEEKHLSFVKTLTPSAASASALVSLSFHLWYLFVKVNWSLWYLGLTLKALHFHQETSNNNHKLVLVQWKHCFHKLQAKQKKKFIHCFPLAGKCLVTSWLGRPTT